MTEDMNKYVGLQMQASLSEAVSEARYADSLGLTGIQANTVNLNMNTAMLRAQTDGLKASQATYTLSVAPHVLNYVTALSYFLFPLIFIVAIVKGLFFGLKVLFNYVTGLLAIEVYRWSLAIIHGITSSLTSKNAAEVLMGGKGAEMIHSTAYYSYMASETDVALFMVKIVWVLPLIIWSGSVAMVMRTGAGAAEANGMQDTQGAAQQIMSANATQTSKMMAENLTGNPMPMAEYLTTVQGGRELDMQVQALSAAMKASHSDDYLKGALGQSAQQIGSTMGYGSQMKDFKDINQVMEGGKYGGISQATSALDMGNVMKNGSFSAGLSENIEGQALAKASGHFQADSQIGQAKGLIASGIYDRNGNVSTKVRRDGLNDHDLLEQGLENQSRISVNQTIGVSKEDLSGQAGIDKMNAIQYASHAGIKGQIAQGQALKNTFGKDLEGSNNSNNMSYDTMALNNAENQLNQSVAQADAFGEVKNKYGGLGNLAKAREMNAQMAMTQEINTGQTLQEKMTGGKYSKPTQSQADQDSVRESDKKLLDVLEKIYEGLKDDDPHKQAAFDNYAKKAQEYADKYLDKDGNNKQFDDRVSIDDMASTQAQMNVASQIASTKANQKYLNEVGFSAVASNMATNTDMQNIKSAQTAQSAREEFGDVIGGGGVGSYKDVSYQQAHKSHKASKAEADAYKEAKELYGDDIAYKSTFDKNITDFKGYGGGVKNAQKLLQERENKKAKVGNREAEQITEDEAREAVVYKVASENAEKMGDSAIWGDLKRYGTERESKVEDGKITTTTDNVIGEDASIVDKKYLQGKLAETAKAAGAVIAELRNKEADILAGTKKAKDAVDVKYKSQKTNPNSLTIGEMWNQAGAYIGDFISVNNLGLKEYQEHKINARVAEDMVKMGFLEKEKEEAESGLKAAQDGNFSELGRLTYSNKSDIQFGGTVSSFSVHNGQLQGSSQSGVSFSHNESKNFSYGVTASGGSMFAAGAHALGMNMGSYATMSSSIAAAGALAGAVGAFLPGGRIAGALANMGMTSSEGAYAMGIGSYKAKQEKDTKVGLNTMRGAQSSVSQAMDNVNQADNRLTTSRQSVARAQKQHDWAREQRAMKYSPLGSTYNGWNSTQLGERSAALQQGIHDMNASVTRLSDIKGRLINDGMSKTDPAIKSLNRKLYKHERQIKSDGRELKYLQYAQNEEIARASLEETQAKYREAESGRTHAEARLTDAKGNFDLAYSHLRPEVRTAWDRHEDNKGYRSQKGIQIGRQERFKEGSNLK